jgi:hypothetical protein
MRGKLYEDIAAGYAGRSKRALLGEVNKLYEKRVSLDRIKERAVAIRVAVIWNEINKTRGNEGISGGC